MQAYNSFLQQHSSILFPTFIEEELVGVGLAPGEAVIVYFLATLVGSVFFSILFRVLRILAERRLFGRSQQFSSSLREVAVILEFLPFSILLSSNMDLRRYHQRGAGAELGILNFVLVWFCLIFLLFTYEQRKRRPWTALLNLSYSLFSFMLGLLYTLGYDLPRIAIFVSSSALLLLALAVAYFAKKQCHASLVFLLECFLYLAVAVVLLLILHWDKSHMLLGWILISLEALFFVLNIAVLIYRLAKNILALKAKCDKKHKISLKNK